MRASSSLCTTVALVGALVAAPACAQGGATPNDGWERLTVQSLRKSEQPRDPVDAKVRAGLRALWVDRLDADERDWQAKPGPSGGSYPARSQWALLKLGDRGVLVSALAGTAECSLAGSFDKSDLFTWCVLRVQVAGYPTKHFEPACWIESAPGETPDPTRNFMRARIEGSGVHVQVVQRGKPVPECDKLVALP